MRQHLKKQTEEGKEAETEAAAAEDVPTNGVDKDKEAVADKSEDLATNDVSDTQSVPVKVKADGVTTNIAPPAVIAVDVLSNNTPPPVEALPKLVAVVDPQIEESIPNAPTTMKGISDTTQPSTLEAVVEVRAEDAATGAIDAAAVTDVAAAADVAAAIDLVSDDKQLPGLTQVGEGDITLEAKVIVPPAPADALPTVAPSGKQPYVDPQPEDATNNAAVVDMMLNDKAPEVVSNQ